MFIWAYSLCVLLLVDWFVLSITFTAVTNLLSSLRCRIRYPSSRNNQRPDWRNRRYAVLLHLPAFPSFWIQRHNRRR